MMPAGRRRTATNAVTNGYGTLAAICDSASSFIRTSSAPASNQSTPLSAVARWESFPCRSPGQDPHPISGRGCCISWRTIAGRCIDPIACGPGVQVNIATCGGRRIVHKVSPISLRVVKGQNNPVGGFFLSRNSRSHHRDRQSRRQSTRQCSQRFG